MQGISNWINWIITDWQSHRPPQANQTLSVLSVYCQHNFLKQFLACKAIPKPYLQTQCKTNKNHDKGNLTTAHASK